jgi:hypothetical protein
MKRLFVLGAIATGAGITTVPQGSICNVFPEGPDRDSHDADDFRT